MKYSFWFRGAFIFQLTTGFIHSLSFFVTQQPSNETEKQLLDLMTNYKMDMGNGFHRSMTDIVTSLSACMTMLCFLAGLINWALWRHRSDTAMLKHVMLIQTVVFGVGLAVMIRFAFLPPIVCFALIWICCFMAFLTLSKKAVSA